MMKPIPLKAWTDNYIWVIPDERSASFLCVDPGDPEPVLDYAKQSGLALTGILVTHHHPDHINGLTRLKEQFNPQIWGPVDPRIPNITDTVADKDVLNWNSLHFQVLSTPGHTSTHLSYLEPEHLWLFCGDTLFSGGCGRVFDGTIEELHASLQRYKTLPLTTQVYCTHEYTASNLRFAHWVEPENQAIGQHQDKIKQLDCSLPSTLGLELCINPFLRTNQPTVVSWAKIHGAASEGSLDVFSLLREHKNNFK